MKQYIYYLKTPPNARFHFGEVASESSLSSSSSYAHSDTLFGALIHNAFLMDKEKANELLQHFQSNDVVISSALFFIQQQQKKIIFFPKPIVYDLIDKDQVDIDLKKLKGIKMISAGVLQNELSSEDWFDPEKCILLQNGEFVCLVSELEEKEETSIYQKMVTPKNPLSYTSDPEDKRKIYYQTDVFLSDNPSFSVGYYFLLKHSATLFESILKFLDASIDQIKVFGLGGDRSTGAGTISAIEKEQFYWEAPGRNAYFTNLSLLMPAEADYRKGRYRVVKRGGQSLNQEDKRLKVVQSILEGGVFREEIKGKIVDIGPENLKYGIPYFLPLSIKNAKL